MKHIITILWNLVILSICRESCAFAFWCHAWKEFSRVLWWEGGRQLVCWVIKVYTLFHISLKSCTIYFLDQLFAFKYSVLDCTILSYQELAILGFVNFFFWTWFTSYIWSSFSKWVDLTLCDQYLSVNTLWEYMEISIKLASYGTTSLKFVYFLFLSSFGRLTCNYPSCIRHYVTKCSWYILLKMGSIQLYLILEDVTSWGRKFCERDFWTSRTWLISELY